MKTISPSFRTLQIASCLLLSLTLVSSVALGQTVTHIPGTVSFQNTETTLQGVSSHLVTNFDNTLLVGSQYKAELYYFDTNTSTFTPLPSTLSSFRTNTFGSTRGTWATLTTNAVSLPAGYGGLDVEDDGTGRTVEAGGGSGTGPGYYPVTLSVRAWDQTKGTNWESALVRGQSPPFTYTERLIASTNINKTNLNIQMVTQPGFQIVVEAVAASISVQPKGQSGYLGKNASFTVGAYGTLPLRYQWFKDGDPIVGAIRSNLQLTNLSTSAQGDYWVVVTNNFGSVTSTRAFLLLNPAGTSMGLFPGITIDGVAGKTYGVEYSTNLIDPSSWMNLTNLTLTTPVQTWVDTSADARDPAMPHRSYRVVAVP